MRYVYPSTPHVESVLCFSVCFLLCTYMVDPRLIDRLIGLGKSKEISLFGNQSVFGNSSTSDGGR